MTVCHGQSREFAQTCGLVDVGPSNPERIWHSVFHLGGDGHLHLAKLVEGVTLNVRRVPVRLQHGLNLSLVWLDLYWPVSHER